MIPPAEDKEYTAYCQKVLDKARGEYETATKDFNFFFKVAKGLGVIVGILVILSSLKIFINYPIFDIVLLVLIVSSLLFLLFALLCFNERVIKKRYEW